MIKGIRLKLFKTREAEIAFTAFNDGWNKFPHNSPTLPVQYREPGADHSEAWASAWQRGREENEAACKIYYENQQN